MNGPYLYEALEAYGHSDAYPLHMPGHKRAPSGMADPYTFDITEIDGFDNLHHAQGLLKEAQERAAHLYGSRQTFYLVGGSTAGILAAVGACAPPGRILLARNCHRSAYHAVYLNRLQPVYVCPQIRTDGIAGSIRPEEVRRALEEVPGIGAVLITSPTYDGVVSDIGQIARIVHDHGAVLIVDEAHGAHFGMHPIFPQSSLALGADLVIQSLHKTLPALTQTALLHVGSDRVDPERIRRMLCVYETSSPSYVLMASMDRCIHLLQTRREALFAPFARRLEHFYEEAGELKHLRILRTDDPSKILIGGAQAGLSGLALCDILRRQDHLELEMAAGSYALALTSVGDTDQGFARLLQALCRLDDQLPAAGADEGAVITPLVQQRRLPQQVMGLFEAWSRPGTPLPLAEAAGRVSAEFLYLYPPGIPLLVPGERVPEQQLQDVLRLREQGYVLQGLDDQEMKQIKVVEETKDAGISI